MKISKNHLFKITYKASKKIYALILSLLFLHGLHASGISDTTTILYKYHWDIGFQNWLIENSTERTYTAELMTERIIGNWNWDQLEFINNERSIFYYQDNQVSIEVKYVWLTDRGVWREDIKREYTYSEGKNLKTYNKYRWQVDSLKWLKEEVQENIYVNNILTESTVTTLDANTKQLKNAYRITYSYPEIGKETQVFYNADSSGNNWLQVSKKLNTYNNNMLLLESIQQIYEIDSKSFVNSKKETFQYLQNSISEYKSYTWLPESKQWMLSLQVSHDYNKNGLLGMETSLTYDAIDEALINSRKTEYLYGENDFWAEKVNFIWDTWSASWQRSTKWSYELNIVDYYPTASSSNSIMHEKPINVFPVPFKNGFYVSLPGNAFKNGVYLVRLVDLYGKTFLHENVYLDGNEVFFPAGKNLPPGIYMLSITNHKGSIHKRIIKE